MCAKESVPKENRKPLSAVVFETARKLSCSSVKGALDSQSRTRKLGSAEFIS